jgi:RNA polymerase-binding transcription factor DksA
MSKKTTKSKSKPSAKAKPKSKKPVKKAAKAKPAKPAKKKAIAKPVAKKKKAAVVKSKAVQPKKLNGKAANVKGGTKSKPQTLVKKNINQPVKKSEPKKESISSPAKPPVTEMKAPVSRPMPVDRKPEPARAIISRQQPKPDSGKNRYSDNELEEFRDIINKKLEDARKELGLLQAQMTAANEHGTDDTASTFKILEDGSDSLAKEEAGQLASRQKKFIEQLENALVRIENKTYGICRVTGKLIPKERLRAVPHTTQSIEAKLNQYRD